MVIIKRWYLKFTTEKGQFRSEDSKLTGIRKTKSLRSLEIVGRTTGLEFQTP